MFYFIWITFYFFLSKYRFQMHSWTSLLVILYYKLNKKILARGLRNYYSNGVLYRQINSTWYYFVSKPNTIQSRFQIDKSNSNEVVLKSLELSSSGTYRCEVSAEAPSFQTVFQDRDMITVGMLQWKLVVIIHNYYF